MALVPDDAMIRPVVLPCRLGERSLFTVKFLMLAKRPNPFGSAVHAEPPVDMEAWPAAVEGVLYRSCPIRKPLPRHGRRDGAIRYVPQQYRRYYVDLHGSFEAYLKHFSAKSRATLKRKVRKFADFSEGAIRWHEYRSAAEMDEYCWLAHEVSVKTYQERRLKLALPTGEHVQRQMRELAGRGSVRGYVLFDQDLPIAYLQCPIEEGVARYQYLGYDPEFARWSPGAVLQYLVLEKLFDEGALRIFDFGEGEGPQKAFFATGSIFCADIYYLRWTARNRSLTQLHATLDGISSGTGRLLDAVRLKRIVKRWLRGRS